MALTLEQLERLSRLLDRALELDEVGRNAWYEALGPEHADILPELRKALFPRQPLNLDSLAPKVAMHLAGAAASLQAGARIGPYVLVRELGAGGMARVWLAQRADGIMRRDVALKIPSIGSMRPDIAERFARETEFLAGLEHTYIARLYDAGLAPEGYPYLAMEYVPGRSITSWCDARRLDVRGRIGLMLQVLEAVQYAHSKGVLHRDLKPSNILVNEQGQVRLLDFGVARMLEDNSARLTQVWGRALTPEYASPEQFQEQELTPASDVYSLGVMLFELLTGKLPFRAAPPATGERLRHPSAEATTQAGLPSTRIDAAAAEARGSTTAQLGRALKGEIDAIVLKALALSTEDRYPTAFALDRDLRRYLSGEAVEAIAHSSSYRARKYVSRHRTAAFAAVAALLIGGLAYALWRAPGTTLPASTAVSNAVGAAVASAGVIPTTDRSLVVLPFRDMSAAQDQEPLAEGLTEELINRLSQNRDLRVIARTSSYYFKGKPSTVDEIARTLHVSHVLEGSVQKEGGTMRISVQLIRAADGANLWSHTYERNISGIFRLQDEIVSAVQEPMHLALGLGMATGPSREHDVRAYTLFLNGSFLLNRGNAGDYKLATEQFEKAVAIEPGYVLAWAKIGNAWLDRASQSEVSYEAAAPHVLEAARRALAIDANSPAAHFLLGQILRIHARDWKGAEKEYAAAYRADPYGWNGLLAKDNLLLFEACRTGDVEGMIANEKGMQELDPLDSGNLYTLADNQYSGRHFEESATTLSGLLVINPNFPGIQGELSLDLLLLGRPQEALDAADKESDEARRSLDQTLALWALGRQSESGKALQAFIARHGSDSAIQVAEVYAFRGDSRQAFDWLERAMRQGEDLAYFKVDPFLWPLREDPRYRALSTRLKLDLPAAPGTSGADSRV
jgi:serine/threonine protein kinase/TolB-like protein